MWSVGDFSEAWTQHLQEVQKSNFSSGQLHYNFVRNCWAVFPSDIKNNLHTQYFLRKDESVSHLNYLNWATLDISTHCPWLLHPTITPSQWSAIGAIRKVCGNPSSRSSSRSFSIFFQLTQVDSMSLLAQWDRLLSLAFVVTQRQNPLGLSLYSPWFPPYLFLDQQEKGWQRQLGVSMAVTLCGWPNSIGNSS